MLAQHDTKAQLARCHPTGVPVVSRKEGAAEIELSRLSPGDYFGEEGLFTGSGELETIRAMTFAVVYEVAQEALTGLMRDRPSIADEVSVTLSRRASRGQAHASEQDATSMRSVSWLVARIRNVFELLYS